MPTVIVEINGVEFERSAFKDNASAFRRANEIFSQYAQLFFDSRSYAVWVETDKVRTNKRVPIIQMDMDGKVIGYYNSSQEVERDIGVKATQVRRAIKKDGGVAMGYRWRTAIIIALVALSSCSRYSFRSAVTTQYSHHVWSQYRGWSLSH